MRALVSRPLRGGIPVVANATTESQLANDELTEVAVGDLDVRRRPPRRRDHQSDSLGQRDATI
eukprot:1561306-Prymnesium_polylepis.1